MVGFWHFLLEFPLHFRENSFVDWAIWVMEAKEIIEEKQELALALPLPSTIAVAINGKKKSKYVVRWALEKFVPEGLRMFKMLHVRPKITSVPTPSKLSLFKIIIHLYKKICLWPNSKFIRHVYKSFRGIRKHRHKMFL